MDTCKVEVCENEAHCRGYCTGHYSWAYRRGFDVEPTHKLGERMFKPPTIEPGSLTDFQKGWVAGIVDGEGSVIFHERKDSDGYKQAIQVTMSDRPSIDRLASLLPPGGRIYYVPPKDDHHKDRWNWQLTRRENVVLFAQHFHDKLSVPHKVEKLKQVMEHYNEHREPTA